MATREIQNPFLRKLAEYGMITISILIMVVGIYFFKFPNNFAFGGVTGFSTVFARMTGWSAGDFTFFVNTGLLAVGFVFLGTDVGVKTVYASMLMSFSLSALERLCPLSGPLTKEPLLELIFAIFCPGFGSAVLFNIGASSGGTDIIAMILKKHTSMKQIRPKYESAHSSYKKPHFPLYVISFMKAQSLKLQAEVMKTEAKVSVF